ncbi:MULTISPECIES: hypothetical protein [unclassified Halorubrum]|uniref:DUF7551 domain-containing protein n=1 Tax=unclassified Halorubrum TaxID=2642239 RepID=UPI0010F48F2E|nr:MULTISPECIES: hypothetical protein [unclassified Halorubrum]TKX44183.1 hypothetical protein EXE50_07450 [Halorubrum sp. ARQ200]TKX50909.1 hypothetical protein EXE49_04570 [Halorubrum sp. ASP121]
MIGTTLLDIADHIESLAADDGEFSLVCARYGDRPVPAAGLRFESRETARAAARATEQYRDTLRRYDPELPFYDVVVRQEFAEPPSGSTERDDGGPTFAPGEGGSPPAELADRIVDGTARRAPGGDDAPTDRRRADEAGRRGRARDRVEFCHAAAAATFEALSAGGHDRAESAAMNAYFSLAERVADPDDLCLCLLEAMATALDRHLDPDAQASVLAEAAERLPEPSEPAAADPVDAAFDRLAAVGLVEGYERADEAGLAARPGVPADDATVRVSGYALSPADGRVATLPAALELCRRDSRGRIAGISLLGAAGDATGSDWWVRVDPDAPALDGGPSTASVPSAN